MAAAEQLGRYKIQSPIGKGGMGEVYRATDTRLNRDVAVKMSIAQFTDRFEHEARIVATLNHPNICTLFDVGPNFLVMELIEGPTLADRIREGKIPFDEAMKIARQIAAALEAAHSRNIVHRDLKPGNIKIKPDGVVKVLDFGLAKTSVQTATGSGDSAATAVTQSGQIVGTPAYMSPEQARGREVDRRTDIWAFGAILYEMLTGRRLFDASGFSETLAAVMIAEFDLTGAPREVQLLLAHCLERDPAKRLRDIGDMDLLLRPPEVVGIPVEKPARRAITGWWRWVGVGVGAALVAASATLGFLHFRESARQQMRPVIFTIAPPENGTLADVEVSPDGRWLAFRGLLAGGRHLWLRPLDSLEQRQLPADPLGFFFWSGDSRYLLFASSGQLRSVDVQGGSPEALSELNVSSGGFTTADGRVVFWTPSGLRRVSRAGGVPERVFKSDEPVPGSPYSLRLLPDGVHFLYALSGTDDPGVYVGSLRASTMRDSKRILRGATGAYYMRARNSGAAYILFSRDGSLLAQRFDERNLELAGDPVSVARSVSRWGASANGVIAYLTGGLGKRRLNWYDRTGKVLGTAAPPAEYFSLALSPDAKQVAVQREDGDSTDLWLMGSESGLSAWPATRFTFDKPTNMCPIWSPDGSQIVFASNRGGTWAIYQKRSTSEGGDELLLKSNGPTCPLDFSPDGRLLLYEDQVSGIEHKASLVQPQGHGGLGNLWVLRLEGDRKRFVFHKTEFAETAAKFSPDGKWIVYQSDQSGRVEVYVRPFNGKEASGERWLISDGGGAQPRWSHDGKQILYVTLDGKLMAADVMTVPTFKGTIPHTLFASPIVHYLIGGRFHIWDMTRDGQRFLIETTSEDSAASPLTVIVNWDPQSKK